MQKSINKIFCGASVLVSILSALDGFAGCGTGGTGGVTNLPTLGGNIFSVSAVNSAGVISGSSSLPGDQLIHAFTYSNGTINDIGTLGGSVAQLAAMNASGQATGMSQVSGDTANHAFLFGGGLFTDLGTLGGDASLGVAINNAGQVAGTSTTAGNTQHAFLYSGGAMIDLGSLGSDVSLAAGINSSGMVVGDSFSADFNNFAFIYTNGTMTSLGDLGSGSYSSSRSINDAGQVVGESSDVNFDIHAFLYSGGVMKDLGTLGGASSSAMFINNAGQIIGTSFTASGDNHGFFYDGTNMIDLGTLGGNQSIPFGLNNLGLVVGQASDGNNDSHAFLWQNGVMTDLNTLIPADSGWVLSSAQFINDSGRIVGFGSLNGVFQWFMLDLVAAPNNPPIAVAGPDQTVDCQTPVTLNGTGSSDPDGDAITYQWSEGAFVLSTNSILTAAFDLGNHTITLQVTDTCGASSQTNVVVRVVDHTAPVIVGGPGPITVPAGSNCLGMVPNIAAQVVATDNCTAANALVITQSPAAGTLIGTGQHQVIVTVTDASGNSTSGSTFFTVTGASAVTIVSVPGPIKVSAGDNGLVAVPNIVNLVVATDGCTPSSSLVITQSPAAGTQLGLGSHSIVVTVTDPSGGSATARVSFTVVDTTAPVFQSLTVTPNVLSPANNKFVPVKVSAVVTDNCDASPVTRIIRIKSNDPDSDHDYDCDDGIQITGDLTARLKASRNDGGRKRVYTIVVRSTDASGNSSIARVTVTVPKADKDDRDH